MDCTLIQGLWRIDSAAATQFAKISASNFQDTSFTDKVFMRWFLRQKVELTFTDCHIPHETLKRLLPEEMLTDDLLYFLMRVAIQRAPHKDRVVYVDSQLLDKFERNDLSALRDGKKQPWQDCKVVVCPINRCLHWFLVLLFPKSRICWILDSLHDRTHSRRYFRCQYTDAKELMLQFFRDGAEIQLPEYTAALSFVLALARNHLGEAFGELSEWKFWLLPDTLHPQQGSTSNDCALATWRAAYDVLTSDTLIPSWTPQSCTGEEYTQLRRLAFHLILQDTLERQGDAALMQLIRTYVPGTGEAGDPMVIG
tara:strand:+ start:3937 stop:4869 length:933 start_codon:yes stop_codon:yes gene_type:complete